MHVKSWRHEPRSHKATELERSFPRGKEAALPILQVGGEWTNVVAPVRRPRLEALLARWLPKQRWFGGKARTITRVLLQESLPVPCGAEAALFNLVQIQYLQGDPEWYAVPLAFAKMPEPEGVASVAAGFAVCELRLMPTGHRGVLYSALGSEDFCMSLLKSISRQRCLQYGAVALEASHTPLFRQILGHARLPSPAPIKSEQSNSSVVYGDRFILKLFRKLDVGINPDYELTRFLSARGFTHAQQLAGTLELRRASGERTTLGMLNWFLPHAKDAWSYTLEELALYYERAGKLVAERRPPPEVGRSLSQWMHHDLSSDFGKWLGAYRNSARLLGQRTAQMHLALASEPALTAFAPEPFSPAYFEEVFEAMHHQLRQNFKLLRQARKTLPAETATLAQRVLDLEPTIVERIRRLYQRPLTAQRIRCHGDYHLGQVLRSGGDFVIIDFEGEPAMPLNERRIKRSPLRDVAGMVRSFDYAAWAGFKEYTRLRKIGTRLFPDYEPWLRAWYQAVSAIFTLSYRKTIGQSNIVPHADHELAVMLPAYLLNKAVYEIGYELNNRPLWLRIPLLGILEMFDATS